jgi:hypothetical protein
MIIVFKSKSSIRRIFLSKISQAKEQLDIIRTINTAPGASRGSTAIVNDAIT